MNNGVAQLSVDTTVARTGSNSGRIESAAGEGGEFLMIPRLEAGTYLFSGWVRTDHVEGPHGVLLRAAGNGLEDQQTHKLKKTHKD